MATTNNNGSTILDALYNRKSKDQTHAEAVALAIATGAKITIDTTTDGRTTVYYGDDENEPTLDALMLARVCAELRDKAVTLTLIEHSADEDGARSVVLGSTACFPRWSWSVLGSIDYLLVLAGDLSMMLHGVRVVIRP